MRRMGLIVFGVLASIANVWAASNVARFIVEETDFYSDRFVADCDAAESEAQTRLPLVESNLSLEAGTLLLRKRIIHVPPRPRSHLPGTYSCILEFRSKDRSVKLTSDSTQSRTHLSRTEQASACQPDFAEVKNRLGVLFQQYQTATTLFQGRLCSVGYVEAAKHSN